MKKEAITVISLLIAVAAIALTVYSFEKQRKISKILQEERYTRIVAEESSQKSAAKLATLEAQVKSTQDKMEKLKGILDQEKTLNADLKSQYENLAQTKEDLENKLQETLQAATAAAAAVVPVPASSGAQ